MKTFKRLLCLDNAKLHQLNKLVPKLELEAAVLGTRLRTSIQTTSKFEVYFCTDSRVVLDWISSTEKQNVLVSNRLEESKKSN